MSVDPDGNLGRPRRESGLTQMEERVNPHGTPGSTLIGIRVDRECHLGLPEITLGYYPSSEK